MFRFVFLASLGVLALQPAFGDEPSLWATSAPAMTPEVAPASAIARSEFALAQRDFIRAKTVVARPVLQVSVPLSVKMGRGKAPALLRTKVSAAIAPKTSLAATGATSFKTSTATVSMMRSIPSQGSVAPLALPVVPIRSSRNRATSLGQATSTQTKATADPVVTVPKSSGTRLAALPSPEPNTTLRVEPPVSRALRPGPKALSSREMRQLRGYATALDGEQANLNRAEGRLALYQRQLGVFTSVLNTAMMRNGDDGSGLNPFVRVAIRYRGTPYVWGGESGRGFDCSGFIMRVMRDLGYPALPHSAAVQFNYGMPVARELLKPGDIVFFANTYKAGVSHVGIYLGQRQFIHAANSKVGTIVSSIDEPKWVEHYAGARRLLLTHS